MSPRIAAAAVAVPAVALAALAVSHCGGTDLDERVAVQPGGDLDVDIVLGSGVSFDRGSLEITSHPAEEVRVVAEVSGWGQYAVDLDVSERAGDVSVVGRVEGFLHWAFGGPTVDVRVFVPRDFRVNARIDGGPIVLEDLVGPVAARVEGAEITLRRSEGDVKLRADGGDVAVEDVEGVLAIDGGDGQVEVSGLHGELVVRTGDGSIEIASVEGRVDAAAKRGSIEIQRVRGDVRARSGRGRVQLEDIEGDVDVETDRGRIEVEELAGRIAARSGRGSIDVEFEGDPAGAIETARGDVEVEVAQDAGFRLDAQTGRGEVELDGDFVVVAAETPDVGAGPPAFPWRELHQEVSEHAARVRENVRRGLRDGNWDDLDWGFEGFDGFEGFEAWEEDFHRWRRESREEGNGAGEDDGWGWGPFGDRGERVAVDVNGGGESLVLRSARGAIRIEER